MAISKGSRASTPLAATDGGATSATGVGRSWHLAGPGHDSLLSRLKKTWTDAPQQPTSPGTSPESFVLSSLKPRSADTEMSRAVREAFYKKFANLTPGAVEQEPGDERAYFTEKVLEAIAEVLAERHAKLPDEAINRIRDELLEGILGFGPLQKLLDDPEVSEIMVNGPKKVFVERRGKLYLTDVQFADADQLMQVIEKIVVPLGRRVDETSPMTDARLPDGSRVNIVIRPLALCGPTITIRKFHKTPLRLEDLIAAGTLSREMAVFLEGAVRSKLNIIVSGETGSGKTTTLNALSGFLPHDCRIITIEDSAELQFQQEHVIQLEARQANMEGKGEISIRDLLRNSLHMIPGRIIVGECRGGEALDMLNAMSSGNDGSMTTGHANTPQDMVNRLETMVMMSGMGLPSRAIREQVASAIQLIVHQSRAKDGVRRVTSIAEIAGMRSEQVLVQEIFRWDPMAVDEATGLTKGRHVPTGIVPKCLERLLRDDVTMPDGTFGPEVDLEGFRESLRLREEDDRRAEAAASAAKLVMQQALAKPEGEDEEEAAPSSAGMVFHWRQAMPETGEAEAELLSTVTPSHRDRLRVLAEQLAGRRKIFALRSTKDDEDLKLVEELRSLVLEKLPSAGSFEELDRAYETADEERHVMTARVERALTEILTEEKIELPLPVRKKVVDEVLNDVVGLGPLQVLIDDATVSEIMVNGPDRVYVERAGRLVQTPVKFKEEAHLRHIISQILRPIGRRVDETAPMVDARLRDGSRVNIVIPPIAMAGSAITIRRFSRDPYGIEDLVGFGTLSREAAAFVAGCVRARLNMVISGSTGSGKTTTLNAISSYISDESRIITVEDAAELQLMQDHVLSLEARQSNIEGKGTISIRQLVMNALHMRPDRILVGECRGGEALDMLLAMNTGQDGSLTTLHSNSPYDTILRLQTMVMLSGMNLPLRAINEQIAGAIPLIIHQDRLTDGTRRITHISELAGFEGDRPVLIDIFRWISRGVGAKETHLGALEPTGQVPSFINRFVEDCIELPQTVFGPTLDIDELFARLQAEQQARAEAERRRLELLAREEEAKAEADAKALEETMAAAAERGLTPTAFGGTTGSIRGSILQTRVFTWKDAMRGDEAGELGSGATVQNERRWQLFRKLRTLGARARSAHASEADDFERARLLLTDAVTRELEAVAIPDDFTTVDSERVFMLTLIGQVLRKLREQEGMLVDRSEEETLIGRVLSEFCGYGPIQDLMDDPDISEIMVNGPRRIFVERRGRTEASEVVFEDDAHVLRVLRRMLAPVNRRCDVTSPMVDARLPDGSRINAVIAPLAITGPTITIRKFAHDPYTIEMLIANDTLSSDMAAFVKAAVQSRLNVVVAGGTGSGKTTTLNAISAFIPDTDRIVTIEDTAELQLQQDHIVALESRPANLEGAGQITIRELVRNALHMRPERIIVGECRGGEALDMLQAMATGQSGSLTTAHSNTPKEMITRLEVMVMMAGTGLSMASIREQIAATVDIIVQQERFRDGSRRVTRISEVDGIAPNGEVALHDVFVFEVRGIDAMGKIVGSFKPTGYVPRCLTLFRAGSFQLPDTMFGDGTSVEREYGRIERQRQIEEQRERNLESMRFRGESTVRARRGPTPLTASAVSDELARRKRQRVSLADRVGDGATPEGAPLPDASQPPEEHLLAVELRQRMAEKPPEQDPAVTSPFAQHLDQMGQAPDGAPPAAEGQDLTGHLRSRLPADTALLRRLKKSEKK